MNILTVAVVPSLNERGVDDQGNSIFWCDPQFAPIWTDGVTDYLVASGMSEEEDVVTSSPITAQPDRVNIVVGMDGLAALETMGLVVKNGESEK